MNLIFIGNTGFFGKEIYKHLKKSKKIKSLTSISSKKIDLLKEKNISKLSKLYKKNSMIIFCAGIKKQYGDNIKIFNQNQKIIVNFAASLNSNVKRIIFFSSASVYGEDTDHQEKINEKTNLHLNSYYGISKYFSEKVLDKITKDLNINLAIFRIPLVYGVGDTSKGYGPTSFIHKFMADEQIDLWGHGSELREFIYIEDIVKITYIFINNGKTGIYNIVSGKSYSYKDILNLLSIVLKKNVIINNKKRTKNKVNHIFDNRYLSKNIKNYKFINLESGIKKFLKSYDK